MIGRYLRGPLLVYFGYLREEKLYGNDDPVFPRTQVTRGGEG
jgi:hypothetical protein